MFSLGAASPITKIAVHAHAKLDRDMAMAHPSQGNRQGTGNRQTWLRDLCLAGMFLTRLPFRVKGDVKTEDLAGAVWAFPLIGVLVGGVAGGALMLASEIQLHPLACAFVGLTAAALVTGALHEDGLADVVDGFGGGATRDDKLRIMRDSQIGSYGVLALVFSVGLKASILAGLLGPGMAAATLVGTAALSRGLLPGMMHLMPRARTDGLAAGAGRPTAKGAVISLILGGIVAALFLGKGVAVVVVVAAVMVALGMAFIAHRQIGGYTGDVLGATQQISEIAILMTAGAYAL